MADGRHLEKAKNDHYLGNCWTDLHEIWQDDAYWPSKPYWWLKHLTFKNPRWWTAAIFKKSKNGHISATV